MTFQVTVDGTTVLLSNTATASSWEDATTVTSNAVTHNVEAQP